MAKFAQISYGSHGGRGERYTYIVNDNIRVGAVVYPSVTHFKSGKNFVTMGIVQNTTKTQTKSGGLTAKGQEVVEEMLENGVSDIKHIKTGDELGVYQSQTAQRNAQGQIQKDPNAIPKKASQKTADGSKAVTTDPNKHFHPSKDTDPQSFANKVMQEQLKQQTTTSIYGFETQLNN